MLLIVYVSYNGIIPCMIFPVPVEPDCAVDCLSESSPARRVCLRMSIGQQLDTFVHTSPSNHRCGIADAGGSVEVESNGRKSSAHAGCCHDIIPVVKVGSGVVC